MNIFRTSAENSKPVNLLIHFQYFIHYVDHGDPASREDELNACRKISRTRPEFKDRCGMISFFPEGPCENNTPAVVPQEVPPLFPNRGFYDLLQVICMTTNGSILPGNHRVQLDQLTGVTLHDIAMLQIPEFRFRNLNTLCRTADPAGLLPNDKFSIKPGILNHL